MQRTHKVAHHLEYEQRQRKRRGKQCGVAKRVNLANTCLTFAIHTGASSLERDSAGFATRLAIFSARYVSPLRTSANGFTSFQSPGFTARTGVVGSFYGFGGYSGNTGRDCRVAAQSGQAGSPPRKRMKLIRPPVPSKAITS